MNVSHREVLSFLASSPLAVLDVGNDKRFAFSRSPEDDVVTVVVNVGPTAENFHPGAGEHSLAAHAFLVATT